MNNFPYRFSLTQLQRELSVVSFHLTEALSACYCLELDAILPGNSVAPAELIGQSAYFQINDSLSSPSGTGVAAPLLRR